CEITRQNYYDAANRTQSSGGNLQDGDCRHHCRYNSRQRTPSEMSFQPFQVAAAINDFINARLKKKNREKCGDEYLQKSCRSSKHVQVLHGATLTPQRLPLSIFYRRWSASTKKQGRGSPRP